MNTEEKEEAKKITALVVDDEESQLELLEDILRAYGISRVIPAKSSEAALELFKSEKPDIVFSDIMLFKTSGLALVRKIKSLQPEVPVILISGFHEYRRILEKSLSKPDLFLEKPINALKIKKILFQYFPQLKKKKR